jgi:hypothetical protein
MGREYITGRGLQFFCSRLGGPIPHIQAALPGSNVHILKIVHKKKKDQERDKDRAEIAETNKTAAKKEWASSVILLPYVKQYGV